MGKKNSLTSVRGNIVVTSPKTGMAGAVLEVFSARLEASMATFNAEVARSCLLGCRDSASMVQR